MMKKIITAILLLCAMTMSAQIQQQRDTLRVTLIDGTIKNFISGEIAQLDYSDPDVVNVVLYSGDTDKIVRKYIKSIRFYNRYSNPKVLLQVEDKGAYDGLFRLTANPGGAFFFVSSLASDEMLGGGGLYDALFPGIDLLTVNDAFSDALSTGWDTYYNSIYNTNTMINLLNFLPDDVKQEEAKHAHGEALFLRAYYYYQLASLFGEVPVITDNDSWKEKLSSTTPLDVWGRILLDLKDAITLLDGYSPTLTTDDSRVGKYAAEALLARAYLFYTGFYMGVHDIANGTANVTLPDGSTLTKQDVIGYVNDCVKNSGFSLVPDYRNLWPYTNRYTVNDYSYTKGKGLQWVEDDEAINPEVLFKIKYSKNASWNTTVGYSNQFALYMGVRLQEYRDVFPFGQGWGAGPVAPNLYADWQAAEPQDMRRDASIQDVTQLPNYLFGVQAHVQETQYHEKKNSPISALDGEGYAETFEKLMYGADGWGNNNYMQTGNIHPLNVIRFADVLLMQSELTGTVDGINQVRRRAGLPSISSYSLAALQQERRWELAFEGVRWNDMRRWGDDYCKAALDKQMGVSIYNEGSPASNPVGIAEYDNNQLSYAERYAVNRGFFAKPAAYQRDGALVAQQLMGLWTYDEDYTLLLDYISIGDAYITRYDPAGKEVAEGTYTITPTDNYDQRICQITFSNGSMLPMSRKYSDDEGTMTYDLISVSDDAIVLKADGKELRLRRTNSNALMINQIHGVKWSYGTYTGSNFYTGEAVTFGTYGLSSWAEPYRSQNLPSIVGIYDPYITGTAAADLASFVQANNLTVAEGEADPFAYMVFDLYNNTIKKYTADGTLINTGEFTLTIDGGSSTVLTTSVNATLVPYMYEGKGKISKEFLLRYHPTQSALADYSSPILSLRSVSAIDDMNTFWMFGQRGLTTEEFNDVLVIQRQEKDGTPSETGRYLSLSIDRERFCIYVEDAETGEQIVKVQDNSPVEFFVPYGETVTKQLRFRLKNCNDIDAVTERTFTFTNSDPLPEEIILLAGESSKSWTWDTSVTGTGGAVWGDMGYCGGAGSDVGTKGNGQWWGVNSTADFNAQVSHTDTGTNIGDGDLDAYMTFGINGTLNCYDKNGNNIRTDSYRIPDYDASNPSAWRVGMLNTKAILWPFEINSGGNIPGTYEIVYLTSDKMTLVYPDGGNFDGLGNWGEATFWHFKAKK